MDPNQKESQRQIINTDLENIAQKLNLIYNHFMYLKIFIDSKDEELHQVYKEAVQKHNEKIMKNPEIIDAGFDLFTPLQTEKEEEIKTQNKTIILYEESQKPKKPYTLDFKVVCSAQMVTDIDITSQEEVLYHTGYDMRPRSSLSNTNLRLANSVGTIDAGYRGHLMGKFDLIHSQLLPNTDFTKLGYILDKYVRLVQICAPNLLPILVKIVDTKEELGTTLRGEGGFGSTSRGTEVPPSLRDTPTLLF
jgi:dUTPase